jgi:hypothetical protein
MARVLSTTELISTRRDKNDKNENVRICESEVLTRWPPSRTFAALTRRGEFCGGNGGSAGRVGYASLCQFRARVAILGCEVPKLKMLQALQLQWGICAGDRLRL